MNIANLLKEAEKAKKRFEEIQEKLKTTPVEVSAGGGMVKITCTGSGDFISLKINPSLVNPQDVESLEEVLLAAIKQAREEAQNLTAKEMGNLATGLNIPGLPF